MVSVLIIYPILKSEQKVIQRSTILYNSLGLHDKVNEPNPTMVKHLYSKQKLTELVPFRKSEQFKVLTLPATSTLQKPGLKIQYGDRRGLD